MRNGNNDPESHISASGRSYGSIASTHGAASMVVACSDAKQEKDQDKNEEEDIEWTEHNERKSLSVREFERLSMCLRIFSRSFEVWFSS